MENMLSRKRGWSHIDAETSLSNQSTNNTCIYFSNHGEGYEDFRTEEGARRKLGYRAQPVGRLIRYQEAE